MSRLPETEYDRQRAAWGIAEEQDTFDAPGFAGLTMVDGGGRSRHATPTFFSP